jgi:hypothetical protein
METIMSDLLKEAIADAKAVRETALQNAKMALEEAFTPHLKSMLSAKLAEDDIEEDDNPFADDEEEDEEEEAEDMARSHYREDDDEEIGDEEEIESDDEEEVEESEIIEIDGVKYAPIVSEEDEEEEIDSDEEVEESEELDLEAVIKELEQEIAEADDSDDEDLTEGPKEDEEEKVSEEVEEITEEEDEDDEVKEEVDEQSTPESEEDTEVHESVDDIQAELKEYKEAVTFLRDKLHEVNILNAKLLYTNRLFKEFALSNDQKLKIVETFDRAQTTREIKLVYSTLAESYTDNGSSKKTEIKEFASTKTGTTAPKTKIISEENQVADRFKKLAGILND